MVATRRCRWCGHPIELWTSFGRWMHVTPGEEDPSSSDGTAWWHCEITRAEPPPESSLSGPRWQVGEEVAPAPVRRMFDSRGRQIVEVLGKYGYVWVGTGALGVGDRVMLPPNSIEPEVWWSTVTGLGSTWTGKLSVIIGKE